VLRRIYEPQGVRVPAPVQVPPLSAARGQMLPLRLQTVPGRSRKFLPIMSNITRHQRSNFLSCYAVVLHL